MANPFGVQTYAQSLEQDPFNVEDYVNAAAWRCLTKEGAESEISEDFDPEELRQYFEEEIFNLQCLSEQHENRIQKLQAASKEQEEKLSLTLSTLQIDNEASMRRIKSLEERISTVAAKVVHLGDQLGAINEPRQRTKEALQLMRHFQEFSLEQPLESDVFNEPDRILEAASIIHKLQSVASELSSAKYQTVQKRIQYHYDHIENEVIDEFARTLRAGNKERMRAITDVLQHFRGYNQCIDVFVENVQIVSGVEVTGAFRSNNIFADIKALCERATPLIREVFPNPEQVHAKLLLNLYHSRLLEHIEAKIGAEVKLDDREWLRNLRELYVNTAELTETVLKTTTTADSTAINPRRLFARYLEQYEARELRYLKRLASKTLADFYERKKHVKRKEFSAMSDLRRDIQARVFAPEAQSDETFLCETTSVTILGAAKEAVKRADVLCVPSSKATMIKEIIQVIVTYLCVEHVEYAIELAKSNIPSLGEQKHTPSMHYLRVVNRAVGICVLIEQDMDTHERMVKDTAVADECRVMREHALQQIEQKINAGIEKLLNACTSHVKSLLSEKKAPEYAFTGDEKDSIELLSINGTEACKAVCSYLNRAHENIKATLDGGNLTAALAELGTRVHRVIVDHIYQYQYSMHGALLLLGDVKEYRSCVQRWNVPLVTQIFDTMHSLCVLLTVPPENLVQTTASDVLGDIDQSVIVTFVQLRADYKSAKLFNEFR